MNFRNLNSLTTLANLSSANFLPMTTEKTKLPVSLKIYWFAVWSAELIYTFTCISGIFVASWDRVVKDSALTVLVCVEVIVLRVYLQSCDNELYELVGKLNGLLDASNEILRDAVVNTIKPLKKPLTCYVAASFMAIIVWTSTPVLEVFRKNEFYHTDYRVTAIMYPEPFSIAVFLVGLVVQNFGSVFTGIRKMSLDLYVMHLIQLTTAQYKYLRIKISMTMRQRSDGLKNLDGGITCHDNTPEEKKVKHEMRLLMRHCKIVIEMSTLLKKLLSPHIAILYINNVFRFCFLSVMFVTVYFKLQLSNVEPFVVMPLFSTSIPLYKTISSLFQSSGKPSERLSVIMYATGQLIEFYIMCYNIQQLLDASGTVTDDIISEKWYCYSMPFQHEMMIMMFIAKLECRLSNFQNIDLTLPSFMSILNQAYSVCLFFLKAQSD